MPARRIGILGYDGVQALDLVGPAETFAAVEGEAYETVIIALERKRFVAETGLTLLADASADTRLRLDTLLVPGGRTMRSGPTSAAVAAVVKRFAGKARRIASVCTGVYGLAPTGLLDGRRVTTHWRFAKDLQARYPALRVDPDALFIKDGPFYSSAGITAGIDLALALVEEDLGPRSALAVARELVVYFKRPGGQNQFSAPLEFQLQSANRFADLVAWITGHLHEDLSVAVLAARVFLSPRQFTRAFKAAYDMSPAAFVEELRLAEAGRRLSTHRAPIARVAASVGYRGVDVFRRAFERRFGVTPRDYRSRFTLQGGNAAQA